MNEVNQPTLRQAQDRQPTVKIALIEPVGGHGGMDYYDYGLALGLSQNECKINYYTCNKTIVREYPNVNTVKVFKNIWAKGKLGKLKTFLSGYRQAARHAKKAGIQIAHLHFFGFSPQNLLALKILRYYGLKVVVTVHDVDTFAGSTSNTIEKQCYTLMDGVIVHNNSSYRDLKAKDYDFPPIAVIPHGNYRPFVPQLPLPEFGGTINLLFFGQIKEVKGLDILLKAFAKVIVQNKNFRLTIAGKPWKTELEQYKRQIEELGLTEYVETHFRYIEDDEVAAFFGNSHLVVLPYKRIYQSGVLLMSMSYGRACLTSDLPAFTEIVEDGKNGFTFQSENEEDLADSILSVTEESIKNTTFAAQETITTKFDWKAIGKKTRYFYQELV